MNRKEVKKIRGIFESFDGKRTFKQDRYGNYINPNVHNLWIGFKDWVEKNRPQFDCKTCADSFPIERGNCFFCD